MKRFEKFSWDEHYKFKYFDELPKKEKRSFINKYLKNTEKLKLKGLDLTKTSLLNRDQLISGSEDELNYIRENFHKKYIKAMVKDSEELNFILTDPIEIKTHKKYLRIFESIKLIEFKIRDLKRDAGILSIPDEDIPYDEHSFGIYYPHYQDYDTNTTITLGITKDGDILTVEYSPFLLSDTSSDYYAYYYPCNICWKKVKNIEEFLEDYKDFEIEENNISQDKEYKQLRKDLIQKIKETKV